MSASARFSLNMFSSVGNSISRLILPEIRIKVVKVYDTSE